MTAESNNTETFLAKEVNEQFGLLAKTLMDFIDANFDKSTHAVIDGKSATLSTGLCHSRKEGDGSVITIAAHGSSNPWPPKD